MQLKAKEKAKIRKRRKLWSHMGWHWASKDGWTDDEKDGLGIGFFKHNHSLNCGCGMCRLWTLEKKMSRRRQRRNEKKDIQEQLADMEVV